MENENQNDRQPKAVGLETVVIQIGNSDDKLTQLEWAKFVNDIRYLVGNHANEIHFFGGSSNWENWQNACWIFTSDVVPELLENIKSIRQNYKQESVAVTIGNTQFV
jgi:hypothetical protein